MLRDPRADAELRERGVTVIDFAPPETVLEIAAVITELYTGERTGQHYTLLSTDLEYRHRVFETVPDLFAPHAEKLLADYRFSAASLAFKWPGEDAVLGPHQDITLVDERRFRSYNLWLPLVATDENNGALRFLMGSHRVLDNLRTMPSGPNFLVHEAETVPLEELEYVTTQLGQAIVFDHAMLHGSGPNLSGTCRPAVIAAYRPAEAQLLHHFLPDLDRPEVERYLAGDDFYPNQLVGQPPEGEPDEIIPFYGTPRTQQEIIELSRQIVPVQTSTPAPAAPSAAEGSVPSRLRARHGGTETSELDSEPVGPDVRRTLLDDGLQEHLETFGYAVFDALDDSDVHHIRDVVDDIYPFERSGFHASNFHVDHGFRRKLDELVGPTLDKALSPLLDRYTLYNTLSTMKFPGEDSGFVVHQDWKLVDERRYRGVNVWCPLVDTDEQNGGMLVLPRSHRHLNAIRCGPDFPSSYTAPGLQVTWDQMVSVPVRAGQALIFDHRLLHSSGPNRTTSSRPAVVAVMMPAEADLLHWFLPDPDQDRLELLAIDEDFFCDFEVGVRPPYPVIDEVPFVPDGITPEELVAVCVGNGATSAGAPDAGPSPHSHRPEPVVRTSPLARRVARSLLRRVRHARDSSSRRTPSRS